MAPQASRRLPVGLEWSTDQSYGTHSRYNKSYYFEFIPGVNDAAGGTKLFQCCKDLDCIAYNPWRKNDKIMKILN